jgi:hypothetical protein
VFSFIIWAGASSRVVYYLRWSIAS